MRIFLLRLHKEVYTTARKPFPLLDLLPEVLHGVILDYHWDLGKLHSLTGLQEVTMLVSELAWHLELPFWADSREPFVVCPAEVAADCIRHSAQWDRTMAADLQFPLHARLDCNGNIIVLDGIHRLLKASVLGLPFVNIRILTDEDLNKIAV